MNMEELEKFLPENDEDIKKIFSKYGIDFEEIEKEFDNYSPKKTLKYEIISEDAVEPKYNYDSDSGFDLHSTEEITLTPFGRALVPTGLKFDIPDGCEIQVRPKSGLAINQGITVLNTPGTVDSGYNGEVKVIVFNTNNSEFKIEKGMKIAQAVFCPVINGKWVDLKKVENVDEKDRGDKGFGSTGIK